MTAHAALVYGGEIWHETCQVPSSFADWTLVAYGLAYQSAWSMEYVCSEPIPEDVEDVERDTLYIWTTED